MKTFILSISLVYLSSLLLAQDGAPQKKGEPASSDTPAKVDVAEPKSEKKAEKPAPDAAKKEEKKTVKVKTELFETKLELDGVVESKKNTPIRVNPKSWADLSVEEVAEHGTMVKKGDVILRFETEKLVKSIEDQEVALPLAELKLETAKIDLDLLKKTTPINLEAKRKSKAQKEDDFAYFEEVRRPMEERGARERLKSHQNYLSYAEEELKQLKKMYENDDMTEETEEIILKRAQDSVDRDRWGVEQAKISTDRSLNVSIPREHENLKRSLKLMLLDSHETEKKAKRELDTKRLEVEEQERTLAKSVEKVGELKSDLKALIVKAPHDGIVYYGDTKKGKWITAAAVEKKLLPGGRATAGEVLLTLVDPSVLQVRATVAEDKLKDLKVDQVAKLSMKWNDDLKMDSKVENISYVPDANATFDTVFTFDKTKADFPVFPGMNTKLKIDAYRNENALVVPLKAVKKDDDKSYVMMKDGKKRWVETGRANKEKQEITSGVKAGDEIEADISGKTEEKK